MKTLLRLLVLVLFFAVASAWAEVTLKPVVGVSSLSGKTSYDITFGGTNVAMDPTYGWINGESKLEYDLKATLMHLGLEAELDGGSVGFSAGYEFSVSEGDASLRDRDWFYNDYMNNVRHWDPLEGDTLSDTKSPVHNFDLGMKVRLFKDRGVRVFWLLDYEYQKLGTFQVNDVDGFYRGWLTYFPANGLYGEQYRIHIGNTPALTYEVEYNYYKTGFSAEFDLGAGFGLEGTARAGYVSYSDKDDHILRSRIANGSGHGYEGDCTGAVSWNSRGGFGASVFVRYQSLTADGTQDQYYYGGQFQGESDQVSQTVSSSQTSFGVEMTYRFGKKLFEEGRGDKRNELSRVDPTVGTKPGTAVTATAGAGVPMTAVVVATPVLTAQVSATPTLNATPDVTSGTQGLPLVIPTATPSLPSNF